jgi:acyl-CoA thioester hydrolase
MTWMLAPLVLYETVVKREWIDYYHHMNVAYYVLICDEATGAFWDYAHDGQGIGQRGGAEMVVLESHVNYLKEVVLGDPVRVTTQLLEVDDKRLRLFHTMTHATAGFVAATNEIKAIGFDLDQRRIMSFRPAVRTRLQDIWQAHQELPQPTDAGQGISLKKR